MIKVANSVAQCAARHCRAHPEALQSHARLIGEYVFSQKACRAPRHNFYVAIITGRTTTPDDAVLNSGDVVVSPTFPKLRGRYCAYHFAETPKESTGLRLFL